MVRGRGVEGLWGQWVLGPGFRCAQEQEVQRSLSIDWGNKRWPQSQDYLSTQGQTRRTHYHRLPCMTGTSEVMRKKLSENEIDKVAVAQAEAESAWVARETACSGKTDYHEAEK